MSDASSAANNYKYKIEQDEGEGSASSLLGSDFAKFVAFKAYMQQAGNGSPTHGVRKGRTSSLPSPNKKVDPFKPIFFMDPKYNPALNNTHICYEYDAHYQEMDRQWNRAGKKFSGEPRIGKPPSSDQGPTKREEFPQYCEKEKPVFGKVRQLKPFYRAQQYTRPIDRCTIPFRPTKDEETSHLGPGSYLFPDPWNTKSGHGNAVGTHPIISTSPNVTTIPVDPDDPPLMESRYHQQLTGSPSARAKSPKASSRSRPNTTTSTRPTLTTSLAPAASTEESFVVGSKIMRPGGSYGASMDFNDSDVWDFETGLATTAPSRLIVHTGADATQVSSSIKSRMKGFSFGKGTFSTGAMDTVTGTTNADLLYRRVKMADGAPLIYATSKVVKDLPQGSKESKLFGIDNLYVDASLNVISGLVAPVGASPSGGYNLDPDFTPSYVEASPSQVSIIDLTSSADSFPVTFSALTPLSPDYSKGSHLPSGGFASPIVHSSYRPPSVLSRRSSSGSPPKTAPARGHDSSPLKRASPSVRHSEKIAFKQPPRSLSQGDILDGSTSSKEAYRRLLLKKQKKDEDSIGASSAKVKLGLGLDSSLVDSLGGSANVLF